MKKLLVYALLLGSCLIAGCTSIAAASGNEGGPAIENVTTSSKVLAKSDCIPTSVTISADVSSNSGVKSVTLWYRIGRNQQYASQPMLPTQGNTYSVVIVALEIPGGEYGTLEFYVTAEDEQGNQSKSPLDTSVELLYCVGH